MNYSVLMSVYYKENPQYLKQAIDSMLNQTLKPEQFVIVEDGKLNNFLHKMVMLYKEKYSDLFTVIELKVNVGLGMALDIGLQHCRNELVARMDSDDICYVDRFEKELLMFERCPAFAIVGSNVTEFIGNEGNIVAVKTVPETSEKICKYIKIRNPFNHPSVMFRKSEVENAGGYLDLFRYEDYYLWYRMIKNGCIGYNIQDNLVNMRTSKEFYRRRGGFKTLKGRILLNKMMYKDGYINWFQYVYVYIINYVNALMPSFLRGFLYRKIFRKSK